MQPLTASDPEMKSADLVAENIAKLRNLFPEAFAQEKLDFDVLRQLLGDVTVGQTEEKFGLHWNGKQRARQLALTPSSSTLLPCPSDSMNWDTTQHIFIEGDNLEVLKLLQKSYSRQVKLIYIDPPYNTGNDMVYRDDYRNSLENYERLMGWRDQDGARVSSLASRKNSQSSGRFHTDWLNMMYPRLKLARSLLRSDGVLLVSLDDGEAANIQLVLNEVFGEELFVGVFPWRSRTAKADVPFGVSKDVEWVIAYGEESFLAGRAGERKYYKSDDYEDRWRIADLTTNKTKEQRPNSYFTMENPKNGAKYPASEIRTWAVTRDTFPEYYSKGKIIFPGDYEFLSLTRPAYRVFESEDKAKALARYGTDDVKMSISTYLPEKEIGRTEDGSKQIRELFGNQVFSYPKPVSLIEFFIRNATAPDSIVLDFFAGSGTTAHAVVSQNLTDDGNRRYILVQLPAPLDPNDGEQKAAAEFCDSLGKPRNLAEITKERLRRVAKTVEEKHPEYSGDLGFRAFRLASSNILPWDPTGDDLENILVKYTERLRPGRSEQDILYEVLLKRGLDLSVTIEQRSIAEQTVYSVGAGVLIVCLSPAIATSHAEALALGIVDWHREMAPSRETTVVFRDDGFADDVTKTNVTAILQQYGLENVRSL